MNKMPLKATTKEILDLLLQKKQRRVGQLHVLPPYTVIFCEGIKTEPLYIQGFTSRINEKYSSFTTGERITVLGTGRNTRNLLSHARKTIDAEYPECDVVWLVYDKDDFSNDDFDNTQFSAETKVSKQDYRVAWSNECIELWFVLHYQPLFSRIGRGQYRAILRRYFPYEKNSENIYVRLKDKTNIAITRAKALYEFYGEGMPPSQRVPATRVHELVIFLNEYL